MTMRYTNYVLQACAALLLLSGVRAAPAQAQRPLLMPKAVLTNFQLTPTSVVGGKSSVGTLTLNNPAPAGGAVITLISNNKAAQPARSIAIQAGMRSVNFSINTYSVQSDASATLSASYQGVTRTASLAIHPAPVGLLGVYTDAQEGVGGAGIYRGTVLLNAKAPVGGVVVTLASSNAALSVPASVTVLAGNNSAYFEVTPNTVERDIVSTLSAAYNGINKSSRFIVRANVVQPFSLHMYAEDVQAGDIGYVNIVLSGTAAQNVIVTITSDDPSVLSVSHMEVIPAGYDSILIPFHTASVAKSVAVNINARIDGSSSSTSVTLFAPRP